jgi:hypothetical protein
VVARAPRPQEIPQRTLPMVNMAGLTDKAISTAPMIQPKLLTTNVFLRPILVKIDPPNKDASKPPIQKEDTEKPLQIISALVC